MIIGEHFPDGVFLYKMKKWKSYFPEKKAFFNVTSDNIPLNRGRATAPHAH
jgi:hypothetical protein